MHYTDKLPFEQLVSFFRVRQTSRVYHNSMVHAKFSKGQVVLFRLLSHKIDLHITLDGVNAVIN